MTLLFEKSDNNIIKIAHIGYSIVMMENENNQYISLKEAEKITPYSANYLGLRARQGKLKAIKIGRDWFTKKEWLEEYIGQVEEYKAKRRKEKKQPSLPKKPQKQLFLPKPVSVLLSLFILASLLSFALAYPSSFLSSFKSTFSPFSSSLLSPKDESQSPSFLLSSSFKSSLNPVSSFSSFLEDTKYLSKEETTFLSLADLSSLLSPTKPIKKAEIKEYFSFIGQFLKSKANTLLSLIWPEKFLKEDASLLSFESQKQEEPSLSFESQNQIIILQKQIESLFQDKEINEKKIESLKEQINLLKEKGIKTTQIVKEIQRIEKVYPKEIIEKQIKVLASEDLKEIQKEIKEIKKWKEDIDNLRKITEKLQAQPTYTLASTAPIYVGYQGIQTSGLGSFDSLSVSTHATVGDSLSVSGSTTLGSPSKTTTLTVYSTGTFKEHTTFEKGATFGTSTLTIDENGNLETTGTITAQNIQIQDTGTTTFGGVTYTWPASGGTNGQVLTTDGSGNLSWQTISSGNLNASYLVLSLDDNLTNERVLTQGEGISFEDTGANGTLTISLDATTDIIPEGTTNLYWTQQRFDTAFSNKTTDDLSEGTTNLYYTDSRARQVLSASAPITYNSSTGVIGLTTPLATTYGGTGIDTSSSTGVPSISSGTWSVNSVLPLSLGGTNANLTGTSGGIVYSTDSALAISSAGISGQILTS